MKKIIILILSVLMLTSCNTNEKSTEEFLDLDKTDIKISYANRISDGSFFLGGLNNDKFYISSVRHIPIFKFDNTQDLENFKASCNNKFDFDAKYNEVKSFNEACEIYNELFFEDKTLLLVYIQSGSGSYRYGVDRIYAKDGSLCVFIEQTNNPEICTDDEAGWFITIAIDKSISYNIESFDAIA